MSVNVAIVGATGAVGQEFLTVLAERNFPIKNLKLLASARSAGKTVEFNGQTYTVEELTHDSFKDVQIAFFSAGGSISKEFAPAAVKAGAVVVDNTSRLPHEGRHPAGRAGGQPRADPQAQRRSSPTRTARRSS